MPLEIYEVQDNFSQTVLHVIQLSFLMYANTTLDTL